MRLASVLFLAFGCGNNNTAPPDATPCTPFDVYVPDVIITNLVAVGSDYAATFMVANSDVVSFARIHADGTFEPFGPLADAKTFRNLAWDGQDVVYLASSEIDTYLAFIKPDGTGVRVGPRRGKPATRGTVQVRHDHRGAIYDVTFTVPNLSGDLVSYVQLQASGAWASELSTPSSPHGNAISATYGATELNGEAIAIWSSSDRGLFIGPPWNGVPVNTLGANFGIASNGDTVLLAGPSPWSYDGTNATPVSVTLPGYPFAAAWSGDSWIAIVGNDEHHWRVELAEDFTLRATEDLGQVELNSFRTVPMTASADRLLFAIFAPEPLARRTRLVQRCF